MDPWLPLTDYSIKYRVSVSTLRRRIKTEDLKYRFVDGRYYIIDEPLSAHQREHRPSQDHADSLVGTPLLSNYQRKTNEFKKPFSMASDVQFMERSTKEIQFQGAASEHYEVMNSEPNFNSKETKKEEPILATANAVLLELKKAFTQILQEKEQQIILLKTETADLRTLVKVLESENERLRQAARNI